jgi:phage tail-like protein
MAFVEGSASLAILVGLGGTLRGQISSASTLAILVGMGGNLVKPPEISDARALSSTLIRIDFTQPLEVNAALKDVSSYTLVTTTSGAVVPFLKQVITSAKTTTQFIEIETSEMTQAASYDINVNSLLVVGIGGIPVDQTPDNFTGIGVAPLLAFALALDKNTIQVTFSERMRKAGAIQDAATYTADLGLTISAVPTFDGQSVTLTTSDQTAGILYTITVNGAGIVDLAANALSVPDTIGVLGFVEPTELVAAIRQQRIYLFIIEALRIEDQKRGQQFLERYLEGPQTVWSVITETILAVPKLWSATEAPAAALQFLKNIVGWTKQFEPTITDRLSDAILRRLIAQSVAFWKQRGVEDATDDILRLVTGARVRILTWIRDFRFILGETQLGLVDFPSDPWVVDDAYQYNVRIVDDGSLDRVLVINMLKLTRPTGETIEVSYIRFLDEFTTPGDKAQWFDVVGVSTVADGRIKLTNTGIVEQSIVSLAAALTWTNYTATWVVQGEDSYSVVFYYTAITDTYVVVLFTDSHATTPNLVTVLKLVGGTPTSLGSFSTLPAKIVDDVAYSVRVEVTPDTPGSPINRIRVYWDEILAVDVTDSDHSAGRVGVSHDVGGTIEAEIIEVIPNPLESQLIEVNS